MDSAKSILDLLGVGKGVLSKQESILFEAEIFTQICEELKEIIKIQNKDYFRTLKITSEKENTMIESNFIRCIVNDIISTEEYTLLGIACYTNTPEEVILEVATGQNTAPTFSLSQKIINLHRSVRPQLYATIANKIQSGSSGAAALLA